jgi:hypothetical protein
LHDYEYITFVLPLILSPWAICKLISWYENLTLPNFGKDVFPKLNPNDIKELPIPKTDKKAKDKIENLVKKYFS